MKKIIMKDLTEFQADYINRETEESNINCTNLLRLLEEATEAFEKAEGVEVCFREKIS